MSSEQITVNTSVVALDSGEVVRRSWMTRWTVAPSRPLSGVAAAGTSQASSSRGRSREPRFCTPVVT
jgi:hypothetical protein